jgi:hypothetical protein
MDDMGRMVALGIECGREREHVGGAKLHTETAGFTALDNDRNTSFCHGISTLRALEYTPKSEVIMLCGGADGCDSNHRCM